MASSAATPSAQAKIATGAPETPAPATTLPEPATKTLPAATQPPKPLVASTDADKPNPEAKTVVMQSVPYDPRAGAVSKKAAKANHLPRKLAETHKPSQAPVHQATARPAAAHQATAQAIKNTIPALRLANDRP